MQDHERGGRSDALCNILPMQVSRGCCPFSDVLCELGFVDCKLFIMLQRCRKI
jgi:hypothetical protein